MARGDLAVSIRGLSKSYSIVHKGEQHVTLAEATLARMRRPLRRAQQETFTALKDINFDVKEGEVVGIIGRNGAGKSTLLKILSRITEPTTGQIELYGRVGSLLEVGTGFHPELTGRENIFLNGAILGMSKGEIRKQFDEIVDFAGVEKFLDTPVKRYSSGMYVRLAFAVAAHLNPEILIVDEVLAVGDLMFQKKCLGKMGEVSRSGRSILFVSHNMSSVQQLCTRAILLKSGEVMFDGPTSETVQMYLALLSERSMIPVSERSDRHGKGGVRFKDVLINGRPSGSAACNVSAGGPMTLQFELDRPVTNINVAVAVIDRNGHRVFDFNSVDSSAEDVRDGQPTQHVACVIPELLLVPGEYLVNITLFDVAVVDSIEGAFTLSVESGVLRGRPVKTNSPGVALLAHVWSFGELAGQAI